MRATRLRWVVATLLAMSVTARAQGLDTEQYQALRKLIRQLAKAQKQKKLPEVRRLAAKVVAVLGDRAGAPEKGERWRAIPKRDTGPLTAEDVPDAFKLYLKMIRQQRWWRIGLEPTKLDHKPREAASIVSGCLAARRAGCKHGDQLLAMARDVGDFLVWTQRQAGAGVIPFPARCGGQGRVFGIVDRLLRKAERTGRLNQVVRNGWIIDDLGGGGVQFDNGLAGVALWELYEATKDKTYLASARAASDWAAGQPCVPNWNYNSFSVYLLAKAYRVTGEPGYLASAKEKAQLGLYPGQLLHGRHRGRWADPHNARIAHHYIMVRALGSLAAAMDARDPERKICLRALTLALQARNREYTPKRICQIDAALEALLLLERDLPALPDAGRAATLNLLSRYAAAWFRLGRAPVSPGVWGRYLEYVADR
jgi:hypothetical protein